MSSARSSNASPTHAAVALQPRDRALARGQIEESVQAHDAWIAAAPQKNDPVVSLASTYAGAGRSSDAMATLDRLPDKTRKAVFDATIARRERFHLEEGLERGGAVSREGRGHRRRPRRARGRFSPKAAPAPG